MFFYTFMPKLFNMSLQDYTTRKKKEDVRHERRKDADLAL